MNISITSKNIFAFSPFQETRLLEGFNGLYKKCFFKQDSEWISQIKNIQPIELNAALQLLLKKMIEEEGSADPTVFLEELSSLIPVGLKSEDILESAKNLLHEAEFYLKTIPDAPAFTLAGSLKATIESILSFIETIICSIGISDLLKPSGNEMEESFKSQKIMMILSFSTMISGVMIPLLGPSFAGSAFLSLALLNLVWPLIKPITSYLPPNAECLTKQVQKEDFIAQGRRESLNEIANILKMNRHAILVGPSRVGKSLTAKAFAAAIERGDYPELKGKVVFRLNTADLIQEQPSLFGGGTQILEDISTKMGRHRNDIILVLDEIHMACKNNQKIADQLKTLLDEGGKFPHVIAITTEEEYNKHVKENQAFSLRFDRVNIENTSKQETLMILGQTLLKSLSKPLAGEKDILSYIYDKSSEETDAPQPATALKLLRKCINRSEKTQRSPTEQKISEITSHILALHSESILQFNQSKEIHQQIVELENQLNALQLALNQEKKELDHLFKAKDLLDLVTKKMYTTVLKVANIAQKELSAEEQKQLNLFALLQAFSRTSLLPYIKEKAKELDLKIVLDKAFVDEIAEN